MIDPTVRHAIRISSVAVVFDAWVANQATWSSNARVWPTSCRAHGTAATTTPCSRHATRGASASNSARMLLRSRVRQRRRPGPGS
jgi:hypothetical protein